MLKELRSLSSGELKDKKIELEKRQHDLRFDSVMGHVVNVREFKGIRRGIARINTLLREYELDSNRDKG